MDKLPEGEIFNTLKGKIFLIACPALPRGDGYGAASIRENHAGENGFSGSCIRQSRSAR